MVIWSLFILLCHVKILQIITSVENLNEIFGRHLTRQFNIDQVTMSQPCFGLIFCLSPFSQKHYHAFIIFHLHKYNPCQSGHECCIVRVSRDLFFKKPVLARLLKTPGQLNPGPRAVKFPCGVCSKGCFWRQRAICCDSCETWYHAKCLNMKDEVYLPYTRSDETFTCFNCGIPNFSSGLFDTVFGDSIANQVANNSHGPSESSIWSSDILESTRSTSCNISNLSSISNASVYDSSLIEDDGRQPLCSSPTKRNPQKLNSSNVKLASLNIQSVMSAKKKPNFWNFLDSVDADIVCGCET